jgi:hypothetical protein
MGMNANCAVCGANSTIGQGFEMRGKFNGYVVLKCLFCSTGLLLKNAGMAMITKKAKTKPIDSALWQRMSAEWERNFPPGSY